jgi:hypothetical protein
VILLLLRSKLRIDLLLLPYVFRAVAQINPEYGTKAGHGTKNKRPTSLNPRVLRLLNELQDFQNPWNVL